MDKYNDIIHLPDGMVVVPDEIWKDIDGYEELYQISNTGKVRSVGSAKGKWGIELKGIPTRKGYLRVGLYDNNVVKFITIHRLVALHFTPNPQNLPEINHLDGDKMNNNFWNLQWCTNKQNIEHSVDTGLYVRGSSVGTSILKEADVLTIREYISHGVPLQLIADRFNVSRENIRAIKENKSWKHLGLTPIYQREVLVSLYQIEIIEHLLNEGCSINYIHFKEKISRPLITKIKNKEYENFKDCVRKYFS